MADIKITVDSSELKRATQHTEELRGATSRFEAKLKPLIDKERQFNKAVRQVNDAMRLGVATQKQAIAEVERLGKAYGRTKTQIDRTTASMTGIRKNTNRMNATIQNAGYQFGDFAVQVQSGQNVMVAFSQQGAQLAGLLPGVAGAVTGVALVIGSSLARALMESNGLFKSFGERVKGVEEAVNDLTTSASNFAASLREDVAPEIKAFNETVFGRDLQKTAEETSKVLDTLSKKVENQLKGAVMLRNSQAAILERPFVISRQKKLDKLLGTEETVKALEEVKAALESIDDGFDPKNPQEYLDAVQIIERIISGEFAPGLELSKKFMDQLVDAGQSLLEAEEAVAEAQQATVESTEEINDQLEAQKAHLEAILKLEQARDRVAGSLEQKFSASTRKLELMRGGLGAGLAGTQVSMEQQIAEVVAAERAVMESRQGVDGLFPREVEEHMLAFEQNLRTRLEGYMQEQAAIKELSAVKTATSEVELEQLDEQVKAYLKYQETINSVLATTEQELRQKISLIGLSKEEAELTKFIYALEKEMGATRAQLNEEQQAQYDTILALKEEYIQKTEAQIAANERLKQAEEKVQAVSKVLASETVGALKSIVNGTKTASEAFRDMALNIIQQIMDILIWQPLITSLTNAFSSALTPASSGGSATGAFGSFVGSIFGFQKGGAFSAGNVIPFANGGVVGSPTYFGMSGGRTGLMGEAGPEAIMPLKRGAGGKLGVEGGGNVTVHQTFNFSANGDESVKKIIAQAAPKIAQMTEAKIINSRQRGGQMRRAFG